MTMTMCDGDEEMMCSVIELYLLNVCKKAISDFWETLW